MNLIKLMNIEELIHRVKQYRKREWLRKYVGWQGICHWLSSPTIKQRKEFEQLNLARSVSMSDEDAISKATGKQAVTPTPDIRTHLHPVKVYDKDMKLIRIITAEEVQAHSNRAFKKSSWSGKAQEWKNKHKKKGVKK